VHAVNAHKTQICGLRKACGSFHALLELLDKFKDKLSRVLLGKPPTQTIEEMLKSFAPYPKQERYDKDWDDFGTN